MSSVAKGMSSVVADGLGAGCLGLRPPGGLPGLRPPRGLPGLRPPRGLRELPGFARQEVAVTLAELMMASATAPATEGSNTLGTM